MPGDGANMAAFWDARAREDALFFVDNRLPYRGGDRKAFWADGERHLETLLGLTGMTVRPGETVLDLGCGVGRLSRALRARGARVIGLDVSAQMLARARGVLGDEVELVHGDGTSLAPLADGSCDGVVSLVVFQHIPDPAVTLGYVAEIGRVLRPGGWAAFQVSTDPAVHRFRPGLRARAAARLGRRPRGQRHPAWLGSAVRLADLERAAAGAGLVLERVEGAGTQWTAVGARRR